MTASRPHLVPIHDLTEGPVAATQAGRDMTAKAYPAEERARAVFAREAFVGIIGARKSASNRASRAHPSALRWTPSPVQ